MPESLAVRRAETSVAITRVNEVLDAFAARDHNGEMLTAVRHFPAREAQWADFPAWVNADLAAAYAGKGIRRLYTHQAAAAEAVHSGKNVVIVTPTASGKTLCYNLPVLNATLENSDARALYLFPTKALAQDQLAELHELNQRLENRFGVFTYDGDTPADARRAIREKGHIVLTNPDMLHTGILPHHTRWTRLFENLRYIVLDELHTYRGVFGSHLCNVLRRLRRIARFYGRNPQFICCSATIANPGELASRLLETEVEVLNSNGAPAAEKTFVFYNPPVVNRALGIRRSYINESSRVAQEFLKHDLQTIVFANSRLHTEILLTYLQQAYEDIAAATFRTNAAKSSAASAMEKFAAWFQPALSSSALMSAPSTPSLWPDIPALSPPPGNAPAAPGAAAEVPAPCWWRLRRRWINLSFGIRIISLATLQSTPTFSRTIWRFSSII
jgi:ATP-dependent helicase YprA (DUF1998 family)